MTVEAGSMQPDPLYSRFVLLGDVRGVSESSFPSVKISSLSLPMEQILYYCSGERDPVSEDLGKRDTMGPDHNRAEVDSRSTTKTRVRRSTPRRPTKETTG